MPSFLKAALAFGLCFTGWIAEAAQAQTGSIRVEVVASTGPVPGATVLAGGQSAATDASGFATVTLPAGQVSVTASKDGYEPATASVEVVAGSERAVRLVLTVKAIGQEPATVVASTRTRRTVDDQAVSIEVLGRDRIEENMLMLPGSVVRSLDEMASLRVQTTSPELGLAIVRMRGLRGQYTRLLADGVPLYFDLPGGLAPAQIPPMDLERIEVIPGGASALFGANAMAGAVNLLSRRPGPDGNREFLFSQSAPDATDAVLWLSPSQTGSWGRTFHASAHRQNESDVDDDGWSDIPEYARGVVRQRVFWNNQKGRSVSGTAGVAFEKREGGSANAHQQLETKIADGALFGQMPVGSFVLAGAGSLYVQSRTRDFSDRREHERRQAATIEIELRGSSARHSWVTGIAADWFANRAPGLASGSIAPRGGIFVHDDLRVASWLLVSGSARLDYNKGSSDALRVDDLMFSPRGSVLAHRGPWSVRVSADRSYFVPSPLTEETEAAGFERLLIDGPLEIETARSVSGDLTYRNRAAAVTLTVFHSRIEDPAIVDRASYTLRTETDPVETEGVEILGSARHAPFTVTGAYSFTRAHEKGGREVALTPRHSAALTAAVSAEGRGRIAVHASFTGEQRLDVNPYRLRSEPFGMVSVLGEYPFGRWRLFVAAENLTDVRQTRWDPITRPSRDVDGRWTVDAWAPLRGRAFNGGLRVSF